MIIIIIIIIIIYESCSPKYGFIFWGGDGIMREYRRSRVPLLNPRGRRSEKGLSGLSQNNNFWEHSRRKQTTTKLGIWGGAKAGYFGWSKSFGKFWF